MEKQSAINDNQKAGRIDPSLLTSAVTHPQLSSTQFKFTTDEAIKDLEEAPKHHYTVAFSLRPRTGASYKTTPWILSVKQLMAIVKQADPQFMILKKREAVGNSITRIEDIPESTTTFTRDYGFDVVVSPKLDWVRFRVLVGSTVPFGKLFKQREMGVFQVFQTHDWWARKVAIAHQGNHFHIGFIKMVHPIFSNHDDVIEDYKKVFGDIAIDIDVQSKFETKKFFSLKENEEIETEERLKVRVLTISTPSDIASKTTEALLKEWDTRLAKEDVRYNRLRDSLFIPYTKRILSEEDQITHLLEQGAWLGQHKDAIFLIGYKNMNEMFQCSKELADMIGTAQEGDMVNIREILLDWKRDKEQGFNTENLLIKAVEQIDQQKIAIVFNKDDEQRVEDGLQQLQEVLQESLPKTTIQKITGNKEGFRVYNPRGRDSMRQTMITPYLSSLKRDHGGIRVDRKQDRKMYSYREQHNKGRGGGIHNGQGRKGRGGSVVRGDGKACIVTNAKDPTIQALYSDVLTIGTSNSNETTLTTTSGMSSSILPWKTKQEFEAFIAEKVTERTTEMIAPVLKKVDNTHSMMEETNSMMSNTNKRVKKLEDFSNQWKELQEKETDERRKLNENLQQQLHNNNNLMQRKIDTTNNLMQDALAQVKALITVTTENRATTQVNTTTNHSTTENTTTTEDNPTGTADRTTSMNNTNNENQATNNNQDFNMDITPEEIDGLMDLAEQMSFENQQQRKAAEDESEEVSNSEYESMEEESSTESVQNENEETFHEALKHKGIKVKEEMKAETLRKKKGVQANKVSRNKADNSVARNQPASNYNMRKRSTPTTTSGLGRGT